MTRLRFGGFVLDADDRRLTRDGAAVEVNARYLDALVLLVCADGALVTKDRFMAEIWRGIPVTDEALTQCIRTLRRALGDDAARPRFIATVPKHGYRFVAAVEEMVDQAPVRALADAPDDPSFDRLGTDGLASLRITLAGTIGAGLAGMVGGIFYGALAAASPDPGIGAMSALLVVMWLTIAVALTGGAGVSAGIVAGRMLRAPGWQVAGAALGGFAVGGAVKLLGIDAFHLLLGRAPAGITGAAEGLALGGTVGLAAWLGEGRPLARQTATATLVGAAGGAAIVAGGGRLMGGSLALLAQAFPGSRLHLAIDGPAAIATGALEGALFAGAIVGAIAARQAASASAISRRDPSTP